MKFRRHTFLLALLVAVLAAYANHFQNGFHFDDRHAVVENPAIRDLSGAPRFFWDVTTFSHDPTSRSYRPLVTLSLALDYWLGDGLDPFWFHLSTFFWFAVQLVLMYALFLYVLERACPNPRNEWIAWFATAVYALHPACAETVNYVIQRGDLYVALGIVAAVALYAWKPGWRRWGLYLVPALAAMLSKPTGVIFAPLLLLFVLLIERRVLSSVPAFVAAAAFLAWEKVVTPPTFFHSSISSADYWITQPYVTLRYFRSFLLPLWLNIDTDLTAFHSIANPLCIAGFVFCAALIAVAVWTARLREWRPVSFGLWWFLLGLIPTAVYPLNEVENDHRMFLPFVGLSLAVVFAIARLPYRREMAIGGLVVLTLFACGVHSRNEVWRTEESLWRDDVQKSPNNARGHFTLGVALAATPSRAPEAISEFREALRVKPDYLEVRNNLAVALAGLPGHLPEAISEYQAALRYQPDSPAVHNNLGAALLRVDRTAEAIPHFQVALRAKPDFAEAHRNLGDAWRVTPGRVAEAIAEYRAAIECDPQSADTHKKLAALLLQAGGRLPEVIAEYRAVLQLDPASIEAHNGLASALQETGHPNEAVAEYEAALRIRPDSAELHNNLGIALESMPDRLGDAEKEFNAAIRVRPDFLQAHYNLAMLLAKLPGRRDEANAHLQAAQRLHGG